MDERQGTQADHLGGRLPLLSTNDLDAAQRALYERVVASRVRSAANAGYTAQLPDGRLIGPFNAMLRVPAIAENLLGWAQSIARAGIPADAREAAILTVAAHWQAAYVLYAHTAAAASVGLPGGAIDALRERRSPEGLRPEALLAHRIATALVRDHHVSDDLYGEALSAFGAETMVALVNLVGQYSTTCALLTCFQVPAPRSAVAGSSTA